MNSWHCSSETKPGTRREDPHHVICQPISINDRIIVVALLRSHRPHENMAEYYSRRLLHLLSWIEEKTAETCIRFACEALAEETALRRTWIAFSFAVLFPSRTVYTASVTGPPIVVRKYRRFTFLRRADDICTAITEGNAQLMALKISSCEADVVVLGSSSLFFYRTPEDTLRHTVRDSLDEHWLVDMATIKENRSDVSAIVCRFV